VSGAETNEILRGVTASKLTGNGSLYKVSPLENDCTPLLTGTIPAQPAEAAQPIAWTRLAGTKQARVFYTSLGHWDDFAEPDFRRLLGNGIAWALGK